MDHDKIVRSMKYDTGIEIEIDRYRDKIRNRNKRLFNFDFIFSFTSSTKSPAQLKKCNYKNEESIIVTKYLLSVLPKILQKYWSIFKLFWLAFIDCHR